MFALRIQASEKVTWQSAAIPTPTATQVLVRVMSAGINGADILQVAGHYPAPPDVPADIPGLEFAGVVVDKGDLVSEFAVGDTVMGLVGGGAQAEFVAAESISVLRVPDSTSPLFAGGFMEAYATAFDAVFLQARGRAGETLLINGGAGGVGLAAAWLAVRNGLDVVSVVRDGNMADRLRNLFSNYPVKVVTAEEREQRNIQCDICLELVGAGNLRANLKMLNRDGRISLIGAAGGAKTEFNILQLMSKRGAIFGSTLRSQTPVERSKLISLMAKHVVPLLQRGDLPVSVDRSVLFENGQDAYDAFRAGGKLGKIMLVSPEINGR